MSGFWRLLTVQRWECAGGLELTSGAFGMDCFAHPPVRVAGKLVLKGACHRKTQPSEKIARTRDSFNLVPDITRCGVEFKQESLFALLDVHWGRRVDEAKELAGIHNIGYAAQIQRPKPKGLYLDGNDLSRHDQGLWIRDTHPSKVEVGPTFECPFCRRKGIVSPA